MQKTIDTHALIDALQQTIADRPGGLAFVLSRQDQDNLAALGPWAMTPVRPTLPALSVAAPIRR
jgi:hypothetical protein